MLEANEMKVLRKVVGKTKIDRIRNDKLENLAVSKPLLSGWKKRKKKRMGRTCNENEY